MRGDGPFLLFDDARAGGEALLFARPSAIIAAQEPAEIVPALQQLRCALGAGRYAAGFLDYAAGSGLESRAAAQRGAGPLLWFGVFDAPVPVDARTLLGDGAGAWSGVPVPRLTSGQHAAQVAHVQALIAAGDIYQANLSFRADVPFLGDPAALYARLRAASAAGWGALVRHDRGWLLSLSPELFFRVDGRRVSARPMKGTRPRGGSLGEDRALAAALRADPKDRAENLMIVDLLRNDLSRVARAGSVRVPALFEVEHYPTLHQMVSAVEAELAPERDALDALAALFPCGSITGAPKLRAMEIIADVETDARGVYTGAIGYLAPDGTAAFNVAIRTLAIEEGSSVATIGLGSAVVADSRAADEWDECLAKGAFVGAGQRAFDLIETMRFDPVEGVLELERHLARLKASALAFGFTVDRHAIRNEIHAATFRLVRDSRVRLRLSPRGTVAIECGPAPEPIAASVEVALVPLPVAPGDFRLRHKTSDRGFYDDARRSAGTFEVVFVGADGGLTEGSFTNLFVRRGDGRLATPPRDLGLLPGILRERLLETGEAVEQRIEAADLAGGFLLGNAVRGLIEARLV